MGGRQVPLRRQSCLLVRALLLWIACNFICSSQGFAGLDPWKRGFGTGKTTGRCRPSNWWNEVPGGTDCLAQRTKDAFETNMKTANIPLLETWESYEASLPVREGSCGVCKLYLRPYLCRSKELDVAVSRLEHATEDRDRVAYLSAPTMRGKSAAILPIFCRSVEGAQTVSPTTSTCHLPITVGIATSLHFNWKCASFCWNSLPVLFKRDWFPMFGLVCTGEVTARQTLATCVISPQSRSNARVLTSCCIASGCR